MESDDECEFDSTWEDEYENKTPIKKICRRGRRNMCAAKDMQDFRHSVRNLDDDEPGQSRFYNLGFYQGRIKSSPDDVHIDEFHKQWKFRYDKLENCHSYIQWLFPIQERGMNWRAHVLTKKEIKLFRKDKEAKRKLVESYKLMLDFYGIRLADESTGEVKRADNWEERFSNLNRYSHNNLRITRILKCLGTLGLQHYQAPLVKFFLHETLVNGQLQSVKQSVLDYFMFAVLDKTERRELVRFAFKHFRPQEQFVWGPKKKLKTIDSKNEENKYSNTAEHKQQRETNNSEKDQQAINKHFKPREQFVRGIGGFRHGRHGRPPGAASCRGHAGCPPPAGCCPWRLPMSPKKNKKRSAHFLNRSNASMGSILPGARKVPAPGGMLPLEVAHVAQKKQKTERTFFKLFK